MKNTKPYFGITIALFFIIMSYYLTQKENNFAIITGYIGLVWWGGFLLFAIYKKITSNKNN
jgi:hypothetical protein